MRMPGSVLFKIVVIVSDIIYKSLIDKLQNAGTGLINKITVMGDIKYRSAVVI